MIANDCITANQDPDWQTLGETAHPDNLNESWGSKLGYLLKTFTRIASYRQSNTDIINVAKAYFEEFASSNPFVIIGWNEGNPVEIFNFHLWLNDKGITHLFFDTDTHIDFNYNFGINYVADTYVDHLKDAGYETVITSDKYFGRDGHSEWAKYLLKHIVKYKMM